ncbi:MAG: AraC family transcriptional regulator [Deltaproteobacteria bacterium]|nr:AraC family transcriptional regulator [Deltaproteobacteria bacterium]
MDVLSDVLSWLRVKGSLSRRSEFSAPWAIAYPPSDRVSFLTIEKGSCFLLHDGEEAVALETGDLVMLSPGRVQALADHPSTPTVPYAQVLEECSPVDQGERSAEQDIYPTIQYGGGGRQTVIRGWGLRFDSHEHHPLLSLLPPMIHFTYEQRSAFPWLETTLRFISHETHQRSDGSDMMIVRLVDLMFVQLIRAWFQAQPDGEAGWLGALRDGPIRQALKLIHQYPADPWTVESLGKAVGMSRSNLSARFQSLVGTSPLKYVTQLRMHLAANALKADARLSLAEIANKVGYDTESSFGRAFKRYFRVSPGAFQRRARTE